MLLPIVVNLAFAALPSKSDGRNAHHGDESDEQCVLHHRRSVIAAEACRVHVRGQRLS